MFLLRFFLILFTLITFASLQGCVSTPSYAGNACQVFQQKYFWFKAAKKSSKKWKVPIATLMSDWGLISVDNKENIQPLAPLRQIKIIPFKEKNEWELCPKYNIGNKT